MKYYVLYVWLSPEAEESAYYIKDPGPTGSELTRSMREAKIFEIPGIIRDTWLNAFFDKFEERWEIWDWGYIQLKPSQVLALSKNKLRKEAKEKLGFRWNTPYTVIADKFEEEGMQIKSEIMRAKKWEEKFSVLAIA